MSVPFVDMILKNLQELPGFVATAQHIAFLRDVLTERERTIGALTAERDALKAEVAALRNQLNQLSTGDEFVRHRGQLWLKLPSGGFEQAPYCPRCKTVMFQFPPGAQLHWNCSQCNMVTDYCEPPAT